MASLPRRLRSDWRAHARHIRIPAAPGESPAAFGVPARLPRWDPVGPALHPSSTPTRLPRWGPRVWLRCSSFKYSRYCPPPCTRRTVGAPLCARRAGPPGWNVRAHRRPRCDAGLSPRAAKVEKRCRMRCIQIGHSARVGAMAVFVRIRELLPEDQLSRSKSHDAARFQRVATVSVDGRRVWPVDRDRS